MTASFAVPFFLFSFAFPNAMLGVKAMTSCVTEEALHLRTDRLRLRQVILNLLGNACKFTKDGEVTLRARRVAEGCNFIELAVVDTGIGMTEEQMGKLFREFSQAEASTAKRYGGSGLGLTIVKGFVEAHGGTVSADNRPGGGAIFTIRLPQLEKPPTVEPG